MASANPEDYTNRGRLITPLKDRFGSQIRTHYPLETSTEVAIMRQEARQLSIGNVKVLMPEYMEDVVATISHLARRSSNVNQRSGVSVRLSVSNYEVIGANAVRRALRLGETEVTPRICDLDSIGASSSGKIEIESLDDRGSDSVLDQIVNSACLQVFRSRVDQTLLPEVVAAFEQGVIAHTGEEVAAAELARLVETVPALRASVSQLTGGVETPSAVAGAVEFILEGLHLSKRLNKDALGLNATYRGKTIQNPQS